MPAAKLDIKRTLFTLFALCFTRLIFSIPATSADEIYKWRTPQGEEYYAATPRSPEDLPFPLPPIQRENLEERIKKIKDETPPNCEQHGGEDCSQGEDKDGSVICIDGFRDAILPFRFRCLEAKLQTELLLVFKDDPQFVKHQTLLSKTVFERKINSFQLTVRNTSPAEAVGIKTSFFVPNSSSKAIELIAEGPEKIPPFGLADFTWQLGTGGISLNQEQIRNLSFRIFCTNCSTIISKGD